METIKELLARIHKMPEQEFTEFLLTKIKVNHKDEFAFWLNSDELKMPDGYISSEYQMEIDPINNWINVDDKVPELYEPAIFIVVNDDPFYHNRMLGGTYQGEYDGCHNFATPGIGFTAKYWQRMPEPPKSHTL